MVVGLTIRKPFVLKERSIVERLTTLFAHEAVWMPLKDRVAVKELLFTDLLSQRSSLATKWLTCKFREDM